MSISIRLAGREDALTIAEISHQTFYETFADANRKEDMEKFLNEQFSKGKLILEVGRPDNYFYLAYYNNRLAGYMKLRDGMVPSALNGRSALELARLYAYHSMIGKGIGSALMQKAIEMAKEMEKEILWLGVWENNQRAIEFYKHWGFEKFGNTDFLLGDDHQTDWLMMRRSDV